MSCQLIAAVFHRRRALEVFALEMERVLVEAGQHQLQLLLEEVAVGVLVEQRRAERFHLARVIAPAHAHDHAPVGDDVGHGVVLGEADRVPHRQHVERAAEFQPLGLRRQPQPELDQVREALVALALEMVLGGPERVEAQLVHHAGDAAGGEEHLREAFVRIAALIRGRAGRADIVEVDLADIEHVKPLDHGASGAFRRIGETTLPRQPRGLCHPPQQAASERGLIAGAAPAGRQSASHRRLIARAARWRIVS